MKFEWKFYVPLLATLAGVIVPIFLWQADTGGKSLAISLTSSVELQIAGRDSIPDLQVTIGGTAIESPVLSTIELANDGSKPVPTSDYEGAIDIQLPSGSKIIRANVSSTTPAGLPTHIATTNDSIKVNPLLLNPGDKVNISIITSGKFPALSARSRIAGISEIKYRDETISEKSQVISISWESIKLLTSLTLYFVFSVPFIRNGALKVTKILALLSMACFAILGASSVRYIYIAVDLERDMFNMLPIMFLTAVVGGSVYYHLLWRPRRLGS